MNDLWKQITSSGPQDCAKLQELVKTTQRNAGACRNFLLGFGNQSVAMYLFFQLSSMESSDEKRGLSAKMLGILIQHNNEFGDFLASQNILEEWIDVLLTFLQTSADKGQDNNNGLLLLELLTIMAERIPSAVTILRSKELNQLPTCISNLLKSPDPISKTIACRTIITFILSCPGFQAKLVAASSSPELANELIACLQLDDLALKAKNLMALAILIDQAEGFGTKIVREDPIFVLKLCDCINRPDASPEIQGNAAGALGSLITRDVEYFRSSITESVSKDLASGLSKAMGNMEDGVKGNAAMVIGSLACKSPNFARILAETDPDLPMQLMELLKSPNAVAKSNGVLAIGSVVAVVEGFGYKLLVLGEERLVKKLCAMLDSYDDITKSYAARAIGYLAQRVDGFGQTVIKMNPFMLQRLVALQGRKNAELTKWCKVAHAALMHKSNEHEAHYSSSSTNSSMYGLASLSNLVSSISSFSINNSNSSSSLYQPFITKEDLSTSTSTSTHNKLSSWGMYASHTLSSMVESISQQYHSNNNNNSSNDHNDYYNNAAAISTFAISPTYCRLISEISLEPMVITESLHTLAAADLPPILSLEKAIIPLISTVPGLTEHTRRCLHAFSSTALPFKLTIAEAAAIRLYSLDLEYHPEHSLYFLLNAALRSTSKTSIQPFIPFLNLLLGALKKLPNACDAALWAASKVDLRLHYPIGTLGRWRGFVTATKNSDDLKGKAEFLFNICGVHSAKDIAFLKENNDNNNSILILPGFEFEVESQDAGTDLHIIQLRETK